MTVVSNHATVHVSHKRIKKKWYLSQFARANELLDGVGVALKVKVIQNNEDLASIRLCRLCSVWLSP